LSDGLFRFVLDILSFTMLYQIQLFQALLNSVVQSLMYGTFLAIIPNFAYIIGLWVVYKSKEWAYRSQLEDKNHFESKTSQSKDAFNCMAIGLILSIIFLAVGWNSEVSYADTYELTERNIIRLPYRNDIPLRHVMPDDLAVKLEPSEADLRRLFEMVDLRLIERDPTVKVRSPAEKSVDELYKILARQDMESERFYLKNASKEMPIPEVMILDPKTNFEQNQRLKTLHPLEMILEKRRQIPAQPPFEDYKLVYATGGKSDLTSINKIDYSFLGFDPEIGGVSDHLLVALDLVLRYELHSAYEHSNFFYLRDIVRRRELINEETNGLLLELDNTIYMVEQQFTRPTLCVN
jgi:hypothetical protein